MSRHSPRLEEVFLPKPRPPICMLSEPASDAPAEKWAEYRRQVDEAQARGNILILLVPIRPAESPGTEESATYCGAQLDALLLWSRRRCLPPNSATSASWTT